MSQLLLVSLYEFRQFLNIVLWIAVPATMVAVLITVFLHYRRKKNLPIPAQVSALREGASPDDISLLRKYEQEVRRYRENYAMLGQEFRALEDKYTELAKSLGNGLVNTNITEKPLELQVS